MNRWLVLSTTALLSACHSSADPVVAIGALASDRLELVADSDEPIERIDVREGAAIRAGDSVFVQNDDRARARLDEALAAAAEAEAVLAERVAGTRHERLVAQDAVVRGAEDQLAFAQAQFDRATGLLQRKLISPDDVDTARSALDRAVSNLDAQRALLAEYRAGERPQVIVQAEQRLAQARARVELLRVAVERATVVAPADGIVDSLLLDPGERPAAGQVVAVLLAGEQAYARVYVPEAIRLQVRPGTNATLWVDGRAAPLRGVVRWVSSDATFTPYFSLTGQDSSRLAYVAKIDIAESVERLPDGIPVEARFENLSPP